MSINSKRVHQILTSEKFKNLVRQRLTVSILLTIIMLSVYFGFMLSIAFFKDILTIKLGEYITLGLPIGIGVIVFAWLLTGVYIRWANNKYDKAVRELRNEILEN